MEDNLDNTVPVNGTTQDFQNHGFAGDGLIVVPNLTPPRIILTKNQLRVLGNLPHLKKTLGQQKRSFEVVKYIFQTFLARSNGGIIPTEINQATLRKVKVGGKLLTPKMVSSCIKFLVSNKLIVNHYRQCKGKNAIFYIGGELVKDLLDPIKLARDNQDRRIAKIWDKHRHHGYDPDEKKTCMCCIGSFRNTNYYLRGDGELSPVCNHCWNHNNLAAKAALRVYHFERDNQAVLYACAVLDEKEALEEQAQLRDKSKMLLLEDNVWLTKDGQIIDEN